MGERGGSPILIPCYNDCMNSITSHPQVSIECQHQYYPSIAHSPSIGFDVLTPYSFLINPYAQAIIHTGLIVRHIPDIYWLQILGKSGLAAKGIGVLGGVIDSDFKGEIGVILANLSDQDVLCDEGAAIAQIAIHTAHLPYNHIRINGQQIKISKPHKQRGTSAGVWEHGV